LQIIGEAARSLPQDLKDRAPKIPWSKIIGMRHILTHDYFEIDTEVVWKVVERDLPALRNEVEAILKDLENKS